MDQCGVTQPACADDKTQQAPACVSGARWWVCPQKAVMLRVRLLHAEPIDLLRTFGEIELMFYSYRIQ